MHRSNFISSFLIFVHCCIILTSSLIFCFSSGDIYLSLDIMMFIFNCFLIIMLWNFWKLCNYISNFITKKIARCFCSFLSYSFQSSFNCICCRLFSMIKTFLVVFSTQLFTDHFLPIFLAKGKNPEPFTNTQFLNWTEYHVIFL